MLYDIAPETLIGKNRRAADVLREHNAEIMINAVDKTGK
jgi:hypothetical protein